MWGLALFVVDFGLFAGHALDGVGHRIGADGLQELVRLSLVGGVGGVKGGQDGTVHDAAFPDDAGQVAGVDALDADGIVFLQEAVQRFLTAPVGGGGTGFAHDVALGPDPVGLHIVLVHAIVADEGVGLGDDLAIVAGVRQGLFKAHHAGGKDDFAHGDALCANRLARKDHAVRQKKISVHRYSLFQHRCAAFTGSALLPASSCGCPDGPAAACPPCRWGTLRGRSWAGPA